MEPQTDREWIMQVDGKVDRMCEAVERLAEAVEKFETTKYQDHENRIALLEKKENERNGMYKFFIGIVTILGAISTYILIRINSK